MRKGLERLGLSEPFELLLRLPLRYEDRTRIVPIATIDPGSCGLVAGHVEHVSTMPRGRTAWLCRIGDASGTLHVRLFHCSPYQVRGFTPGAAVRCFGEVRLGPLGPEMVHPELRLAPDGDSVPVATHLTPVYPAADGLRQTSLRKLALLALKHAVCIEDAYPANGLGDSLGMSLAEAFRILHAPQPDELARIDEARRRLALEELIAHRLSLIQLRQTLRRHQAPRLELPPERARRLEQYLPFALTPAQRRVCSEVEADLGAPHPMMRLVQGDVGSGKTMVAIRAALTCIASGWQVAVMAPTELLAEQLHAGFSATLSSQDVEIALLLGRLKGAGREQALRRIAEGHTAIAIGTHALFQQSVQFARLGLVVVDEQHRFGVDQRLALRAKGLQGATAPHQLIMTATPIPRTLAMVAYADLDVSVIDQIPPGRTPVTTTVVSAERRSRVIERIAEWLERGLQAYWVCPLIDESERLPHAAAEQTFEMLGECLPKARIGLLHGRMRGEQKDRLMREFKARQIDLLVSTTVIEVGVDVPNAGLMVIENAERFGLSQLHQLRGRVGRGPGEAHCVLLYQGPLGDTARSRLEVLRGTHDGFVIAERDWALRGSGELLGTRQTGPGQFHVADLSRDGPLLPAVAALADRLAEGDPNVVETLTRRWVGRSAAFAAA
ncbi:MAG: ATP-dependent DNA helicase RecG [Methylotetracoccus sp.]